MLATKNSLQCCPLFLPPRPNKTTTTATSTLISLAGARHTVTSCISPLLSSGAFKGSFQQLLPDFNTIKGKLVSNIIQCNPKTRQHWRVSVGR